MKFLENNGEVSTHSVRIWNGKRGEIHTYRYVNDLPLTGEADAMSVNWCEMTITHEKTGEILYQNGDITDFRVDKLNVEEIVQA